MFPESTRLHKVVQFKEFVYIHVERYHKCTFALIERNTSMVCRCSGIDCISESLFNRSISSMNTCLVALFVEDGLGVSHLCAQRTMNYCQMMQLS